MRGIIGIDLGATTTKAVVIDEERNVLGRGITNARSNYDTAAAIAKQEALVNARFHLFRQGLSKSGGLNGGLETFLGQLERDFRLEQFLEQLADLEEVCRRNSEGPRFGADAKAVGDTLKAAGVPIGKSISSRFYRAVERAQLIGGKEPEVTPDASEGGLVVSPNENNRRAPHRSVGDGEEVAPAARQ